MNQEPEIERVEIDKNHVEIQARHPAFFKMAEGMAKLMKETGAENFLTMEMRDEDTEYEVTLRKKQGKTPAQKIAELEDSQKSLKQYLDTATMMLMEAYKLEELDGCDVNIDHFAPDTFAFFQFKIMEMSE